jgi:signal transduction histidine kinase
VARDLHDSVTQSLYGVSLYGDAASRMLEAADVEGATELLSQLRQTAKDALQEMRLLIFELRPSELERMGLVGALQSRLDAVESRSGLAAALDADETIRLPLATEDALYRLAQEALNNALRHAQASSVHVRLSRTESGVRLEIADDGIGFDVPEARQSGGVGLHSMAERAAQVGARLEIDSRIGAGSRIIVEVPS